MGFSRHEHWSGLQCPAPGDITHPGIETGQEEKGTTEDEMAGRHHQLNGHEFECLMASLLLLLLSRFSCVQLCVTP